MSRLIENIYYPYSYLHKVNQSSYTLSMIVKTPLNLNFNDLDETENLIRWISFISPETDPGELERRTYPVPDVSKATVMASIGPDATGIGQNKVTLLSVDVITTGEFPSLDYLPHVYLIKDLSEPFPDYFKLHAAFKKPNEDEKEYTIEATESGNDRLIIIKESDSTNPAVFWHGATDYFKEIGSDIIEIEVQDVEGIVKGKGTIRYSNADNKPFDIPLVEFKFKGEECPLD